MDRIIHGAPSGGELTFCQSARGARSHSGALYRVVRAEDKKGVRTVVSVFWAFAPGQRPRARRRETPLARLENQKALEKKEYFKSKKVPPGWRHLLLSVGNILDALFVT